MCVYPCFSSALVFERNYINNKLNSASCQDDIVRLHEKSFMLRSEDDYSSMARGNLVKLSLSMSEVYLYFVLE